jgi:hypothetical protein
MGTPSGSGEQGESSARRWRRDRREIREREERWLMQMDFRKVSKALFILFGIFVVLNLGDIATTAIAVYEGPPFVELNPVANLLFRKEFSGFLVALLLKYVPLIPLAYGVFLNENGGNPLQRRVVKMGVLVTLGGAVVLYTVIVLSNISTLITGLA